MVWKAVARARVASGEKGKKNWPQSRHGGHGHGDIEISGEARGRNRGLANRARGSTPLPLPYIRPTSE